MLKMLWILNKPNQCLCWYVEGLELGSSMLS